MAHELHACRQEGLPERLALEADAATAVVLDRVLGEIPLYRTLDPVQLADVRETVRTGFVTTLGLWGAGRLPGPDDLRRFRANGATRAAEGRPLSLILRAYRVSGLGIYDYVVTHPDARLDLDEERNFARLVMGFVDQLSNEVTLGYVETTDQLATQQGRARRELVEDLLAGRLLGAAEVDERAATLGLKVPRRPCLVVAAPAVGEGGDLAERARLAVQELGRAQGDGPRLQLLLRGRLVVIDEPMDPGTVHRALGAAGLHGVVLDVASATDLAAAYQRALRIHELLQTAALPAGLQVGQDEAPMLDLLARLAGDPLAGEAVAAVLGDLLAPANAALLETLDAYLQAGNAVSAAHRLGVHAQTMRYRLKRIRELTGRDPAVGWDRFLLELALRLSRRPGAAA